MRTTLKRGIGRGATLNGNGHRAVYPPGVMTPMRRYTVPPPPARTTRQLVGWLFRWTLIAIAVTGVFSVILSTRGLWSMRKLSLSSADQGST